MRMRRRVRPAPHASRAAPMCRNQRDKGRVGERTRRLDRGASQRRRWPLQMRPAMRETRTLESHVSAVPSPIRSSSPHTQRSQHASRRLGRSRSVRFNERRILMEKAERQQSLPLDDKPASRNSDPWTSHAAERDVKRKGIRREQARVVLVAVCARPGSTSAELAADSEGTITRHAAARRLPELERSGYIRRADAKMCRVSRRKGLTWWPTVKGLQ